MKMNVEIEPGDTIIVMSKDRWQQVREDLPEWAVQLLDSASEVIE